MKLFSGNNENVALNPINHDYNHMMSLPIQFHRASSEHIPTAGPVAALRVLQLPAPIGVLREPEILDKKRYFGEFRCVCGREWRSGYTWKGWYQMCKKCQTETYAHTQVRDTKIIKDLRN